jgi:predicted ATPase
MIKAIRYKNFKALSDTVLPLGRFTLIVGPNGSGKTTAMQAFPFVRAPQSFDFHPVVNAKAFRNEPNASVEVAIEWSVELLDRWVLTRGGFRNDGKGSQVISECVDVSGGIYSMPTDVSNLIASFRCFSFDAVKLAEQAQVQPKIELGSDGRNLAAVLDYLSGREPERFGQLIGELTRWLPEFDHILFEPVANGAKVFSLRTRGGGVGIAASDLSQGTLFAVALLTLAYLPSPPPVVCLEEPDHGIHPRLLSEIRDGLYRLSYPENFGESRTPVQVIVTSHSPYLLDLYKEHPEEIVIAHKDQDGAKFELLSEKPHISELLEGAPLGNIWFSGILGGVPASP